MASRSYEATPKRLRQARAAGLVPFSELACRAAALTGVCAAAVVSAERVAAGCRDFWRRVLSAGFDLDATLGVHVTHLVLDASAPVVCTSFVLAWLAGLTQTGGTLRRPGRVPAGVPTRLPSVTVARSALAVFGCGTAVFGAVLLAVHHLPDAANAMLQPTPAVDLLGRMATRVVYVCMALCTLMALTDWALARRQWLASLRMTATERRQEARVEHGSPELRAARRDARADLSRGGDSVRGLVE